MTKTTITINGRLYDAVTGMPVQSAPSETQKPTHAHKTADISMPHSAPRPLQTAVERPVPIAQAVHQTPQRSQTLHRQPLQKPTTLSHRSPAISKFHIHKTEEAAASQPQAPEAQQHPAQMHPAVAKALQQSQHTTASQHQLSGTDLKEQLIKEKLAEVKESPTKKERASWLGRQPKLVTILSSTLALLVLGGYLTYITLPSISLKVAASRAGVEATMPEYKPDGYAVDGAITYSPGEVVITYKSTTNDVGYKLIQKSTNWDSQAVLDNYVTKQTDNYLTFQERGLTVYTFNNKAVWVNGGLLYTIDGNASLSSEQILKVATSI